MLKKILKIIIISILINISFVAFVYAEDVSFYGSKIENDFDNVIYGTIMGSSLELDIRRLHPNAKVKYFNEIGDMLGALSIGKIDACATEETLFIDVHRSNKNIKMVQTPLCTMQQAFIISDKYNNEDNGILINEMNKYIKESKESGYIDLLINKWTSDYGENIVYDNIEIENPKRVLNVVCSPAPPYDFVSNEKYIGFDIEFFENFCKKYNYGYRYEYVDFSSLIMGVATGKYDVGLGGITITDDRKQNMIFTDSHFTEKGHTVYYEKSTDESFLDKIKSSFYNSFINENRYKLIVQGLYVTILITFLSTILGILIGLIMYFLYMSGIQVLNILINIYVYIINGLPILVFLMVLYYVVFSEMNISGVGISIVCFSIAMGIFVFGLFVDFTNILDKGQVEASLALGYTKKEAFFKIVLPQIIINVFPIFKNKVVFLLKNTAIVGYIAVADLTRAGDIIRSRTYEAIFPLLSIAFIYFIIGVIIKTILGVIEKKINPRNRTKEQILRGMVLH